jgi:hypothetical protein
VAYTEFTQRLIDRFDQRDPELHIRELTQLRQTGSPEGYIEEFQRLVSHGIGRVTVKDHDALHRGFDGTLKGLELRLSSLPTCRMLYGGREI